LVHREDPGHEIPDEEPDDEPDNDSEKCHGRGGYFSPVVQERHCPVIPVMRAFFIVW